MDADIAVFAKNLKKLREQRGLTLRGLAEATGISKSALSKYETGKSDITLKKLDLLATYFDVRVSWLIGDNIENSFKKEA